MDQANVRITVIVQITEVGSHAGDEPNVFMQSHAGVKARLFELAAFAAKEKVEELVVSHKEIHFAVEARAGYRACHSLSGMCTQPPLHRNRPERAVAIFEVQLVPR